MKEPSLIEKTTMFIFRMLYIFGIFAIAVYISILLGWFK